MASVSKPGSEVQSMVDLLRLRAQAQPEDLAYTFLIDGEREGPSLTYGELVRLAAWFS